MPPAPPSSQPAPLAERIQRLALTLQFAWFVGHFALLLAVFRYSLSYLTFNFNSRWAQFSYRLAFISAVATYGIVVYRAFRPKMRSSVKPQQAAFMLMADENVQYLLISLVWLFSRQVPLALLPFTVYSIFHVAGYTRTNLIPTLQPPKSTSTAGASSGSSKSQSGMANAIGKFVKDYYDSSMMLVAALEILLWLRLFLSALTFSRGSWILILFYSVFLRARFHQSQFVQGAFGQGTARIDQQVQKPNVPPAVRQGWESVKGLGRRVVQGTDLRKYASTQPAGTAPKKAQ